MKIIAWNVNGIRALLSKGGLDWAWDQAPDVLCLQEVKARSDQLTEEQLGSMKLPAIWNPAKRPGYSGVATFYRDEPTEIQLGLGDPQYDEEGRLIRSRHQDLVLFNSYFPSGQRGKERVDFKLGYYERLLGICDELHRAGEKIIITGDFNTAHQPIDLKYPRENRKTSGFLPEERAWVQKYLDHGFVDIFRHRFPDKVQYTWWTYRLDARQRGIGWRLDYFLVSQALVPRIEDVIVHDQVPGSDHCPVEINIR